MQDFLKFLISPLLTKPEDLDISESVNAISFTVSPQDTGRVIGKKGVMISSIRTLLRAFCTLHHLPYPNLILKTDSDLQTQ